jgi:hypothetical protein
MVKEDATFGFANTIDANQQKNLSSGTKCRMYALTSASVFILVCLNTA